MQVLFSSQGTQDKARQCGRVDITTKTSARRPMILAINCVSLPPNIYAVARKSGGKLNVFSAE